MVFTICGAARSTCTQRVLTVLTEKGIDFKLEVVDMRSRQHKSEEHTSKQPFGSVPAIVDDDLTLFESRAICRYIQAKYPEQGPNLGPASSNLKDVALFEQWASSEVANLDSHTGALVGEKFFKTFHGLQPDPARVETLTATLTGKLDIYEKILAKQDYLAGEHFTMVDIFAMPNIQLLITVTGDAALINDRPHIKAWWERVSSRPAWAKVLAMA